jgi:hypothetical protein
MFVLIVSAMCSLLEARREPTLVLGRSTLIARPPTPQTQRNPVVDAIQLHMQIENERMTSPFTQMDGHRRLTLSALPFEHRRAAHLLRPCGLFLVPHAQDSRLAIHASSANERT